MPDYDVAVTGLTTPPTSAVLTTYRPAISVRNNGLHDALASGYIRIYKAGLLVYESEVYSATIAPGGTGLAQAVDYWTPELGTYMAQGYVTAPLDSVEPNNNLAPTTITVTEGPIPPTPPVTLHASQHEEGGADELSIDGLPGRTKDPQVPYDHVSTHEPGGSDELDVTGLHGQLADAQPPASHANEKHSTPFATVASLDAHLSDGTDVHAGATNLEQTTRKGAALGYAALDVATRVALTNLGQDTDAGRGETYEACGRNTSTVVISADWPAGALHAGDAIEIDVLAYYKSSVPGTPAVHFEKHQTDPAWSTLAAPSLLLVNTHPDYYLIEAHLRAILYPSGDDLKFIAANSIQAYPTTSGPIEGKHDASIGFPNLWVDEPLTVRAVLVIDDVADAGGGILDAVIRTRHPRQVP